MLIKRKNVLNNSEIAAFCQQLTMVISAGLPTYYGIYILKDDAPDDETKNLLEQIYTSMESGRPLHEALKATDMFPGYMIHMIMLGEQTGRLEEVLSSLVSYYERESSIRSNVRSAVAYPLFMTAMMLVVITVLIAKVLPVFSQIYEELGSSLTGIARIMLNISNALNRYMVVLIIAVLILAILAWILSHTDWGRTRLQKNRLSLSIASGRFANCMYLALTSGLDTDQSLELTEELISNPYVRDKIHKCQGLLKDGETFSNALLLSGIFSRMHAGLVTIGSKTGAMDDVMKHITAAYDEESEKLIDHFISVLEPTLVIILCFLVGLILISFLLPLLGIMSSIG